MRRHSSVAAASAAIILTACGGGGSDNSPSTPAPTPSAAGLYTGETDNNRQASVLILDDGRLYSIYSVAGNVNFIAGGVIGAVASSNGKLSNGSGIDDNLEGQGSNAVTLSGAYSAKVSINTTILYANGAKTTFAGAYDPNYDTVPMQATVTGTFKGESMTNGGRDPNVTLTADATGSITGTGAGCTFTGSIKPHASGNVYDLTISFGGGTCAYPNATASGVAVMSGTTMRAELQTLQSPTKAGVLFVGARQ
ncbi:hypothetical protein QCE63_06950 [Caballeronia sp. LZ065]|uniref:hypothetical protein n=1 Tax=Caballeronia sp. LZ065 TaxID=3038571 RepID=UPI00285BC339|nr:hypothetical protein [Caballeronia sp. LZ065]MDR5779166.1 hypothetical protein [Caballeronia sp. LZ065]